MVARQNNRPIAIDLFSGAGGLAAGFKAAGFHIAAAVERDPHAAATLAHNHARWKQYRTKIIFEDLRNPDRVIAALYAEGVVSADVVIGGPPCQGYSRSNMRTRNRENPDNGLFHQFADVVRALKCRAVVMENVGDIAYFEKGAIVDEIISTFRSIGYAVDMAILNAADYGVPQIRRRAFFLGMRDKGTMAFPNPYIADPKKYVTVWDAISDLPALPNGNSMDEVAYRYDHALTPYQRKMRHNGRQTVKNNLVTRNNDLVLQRYAFIPQGGNWSSIPAELMSNYADMERCHHWIYRRLPEDKPSVAITNFRKNMLIHPHENRGLSVREAARLQSFPDDFVFLGGIMHAQQLVANAVPPLLAKAVAKSVRIKLGI